MIRDFYLHLRSERGLAMARSVIMVLASAFKWASYSSGWEMLPKENPCHHLNLTKAPPRVRTWPVEGVRAMLAAAEAAGKPSIGDAMMIALYSGQRQNDVLSLVDQAGASAARKAAAGEALRFLQNKTKVHVAIFAAPDLVARLARAEERRAAIITRRKVVSLKGGDLPVVMNSRGNAWFPGAFRIAFRRIRDRLAAERPELGIGDLHFQDLRDTAVTWLAMADCSIPMICSYTGHTLENATRILRHYMALNEAMAREAGAKQVAWLEREGIKL
jgi:integrase